MKNVQDTSLESYFEEVLPTLGVRQKLVYDAIASLGCPTDMEISKFLNVEIRSVGPRRNELMHLGLIKLCEKRQCSITRRTAKSWRVSR
jgi:hypothetical protein